MAIPQRRSLSGTALGVPLKQQGDPHLKPATKRKHSLPNHAGYGPRRKDPDGPPRRPSWRSPRAGSASLEDARLPRAGSAPFEGERFPRAGSASVTYQKFDCFPMCEFSQKFKTFCLNSCATKFYPNLLASHLKLRIKFKTYKNYFQIMV
jgi:hypothetical protein